MQFKHTSQFAKDLKRLKKKYKSLDKDLLLFQKVLTNMPEGPGSRNWVELKQHKENKIFKARLSCRYLKKRSLRIVYAYHANTNTIEMIEFIELYHKKYQEREKTKNVLSNI